MPEKKDATVHLKMTPDLRNHVLGTLRLRGTTMQSFFVDLAELIVQDASLLEMLEKRRDALRSTHEVIHA